MSFDSVAGSSHSVVGSSHSGCRDMVAAEVVETHPARRWHDVLVDGMRGACHMGLAGADLGMHAHNLPDHDVLGGDLGRPAGILAAHKVGMHEVERLGHTRGRKRQSQDAGKTWVG